MFFKRARKDKPVVTDEAPVAAVEEATGVAAAGPVQAETSAVPAHPEERQAESNAAAEQSKPSATPDLPSNVVPFIHDDAADRKTATPRNSDAASNSGTKAIDAGDVGLLQPVAFEAVTLGIEVTRPNFNLFVVGPQGTGRRAAVIELIRKAAKSRPRGSDWVYVRALDRLHDCDVIELPPGRGQMFVDRLTSALASLASTSEAIFGGDHFDTSRRLVEEEFRHEREDAFERLRRRAENQNIAVLKTPEGYVLAPMHDGRVVRPEVFNALPDKLQRDVELKISILEKELATILAEVPGLESARRRKLKGLTTTIASGAVGPEIEELRQEFEDQPAILRYVRRLEADLVAIVSRTVDSGGSLVSVDASRYVCGLVRAGGDDDTGAAVVVDADSSKRGLLGQVRREADSTVTIKPGALHRANGGFLVLDARRLLGEQDAVEHLRKAIESRLLVPVCDSAFAGEVAPVALKLKVILIADEDSHRTLLAEHPDMARLFPVEARFRPAATRSKETELSLTRVAAAIVKRVDAQHIAADGIAGIIEDAAVRSNEPGYLSLDVSKLETIIVEADHYARAAGRNEIGAEDVSRAVAMRKKRQLN